VNLLEKQPSTVYFKAVSFPWVILYHGLNILFFYYFVKFQV